MNIQLMKAITSINKLLFLPELNNLNTQLLEIHQDNFKYTQSFNFIYKGESYIINSHRNLPVKPLHASLKPVFKNYLSTKALVDTAMSKVSNYLTVNNPVNNADIYKLLPNSCHYLLEESLSNSGTPTIKELPSNYEEIKQVIAEVLLLRII